MTVLLDGNVLVAVTVSDHVHHEAAQRWFAARDGAFATCPITEGTLLRLLLRHGANADQAITVLDSLTNHPAHEFWPDDVGYGGVSLAGVLGHRQVTDAYLAALAMRRGGKLATFDGGLAALRPDATELLETHLETVSDD